MLSRLWKGIFNEPVRCGAELKYGVQVHRDVQCVLPKGHAGAHQASQFIVWPNVSGRFKGSNVAKEARELGITQPWPEPKNGEER